MEEAVYWDAILSCDTQYSVKSTNVMNSLLAVEFW
jgi:hypothetical protein